MDRLDDLRQLVGLPLGQLGTIRPRIRCGWPGASQGRRRNCHFTVIQAAACVRARVSTVQRERNFRREMLFIARPLASLRFVLSPRSFALPRRLYGGAGGDGGDRRRADDGVGHGASGAQPSFARHADRVRSGS